MLAWPPDRTKRRVGPLQDPLGRGCRKAAPEGVSHRGHAHRCPWMAGVGLLDGVEESVRMVSIASWSEVTWRLPSFDLQLPCWRRDCGRRLRRHERRAGVVGRTWRSRYVSSRPGRSPAARRALLSRWARRGDPVGIDAPGPMTTPFSARRDPPAWRRHRTGSPLGAQRLRRIGGLLHSPIRRAPRPRARGSCRQGPGDGPPKCPAEWRGSCMRIYDGSPRPELREVLRSIGAFLDQRIARLWWWRRRRFVVQGHHRRGGGLPRPRHGRTVGPVSSL